MVAFKVRATELEARSFFEAMDENHISNRGSCRAKIPAGIIHKRACRGSERLVTLVWTKATQRVQVHAPAAIIDQVAENVEQMWLAYEGWINDGIISVPPPGAEEMAALIRSEPHSTFLAEQSTFGKGKGKSGKMKQAQFVPPQPEYHHAVAQLCDGGQTLLADFPQWRRRYLEMMVEVFGAKTSALHQSGLAENDEEVFEPLQESWAEGTGAAASTSPTPQWHLPTRAWVPPQSGLSAENLQALQQTNAR